MGKHGALTKLAGAIRAPSRGNVFSDIASAGATFGLSALERQREDEEKARQAALDASKLESDAITRAFNEASIAAQQARTKLDRDKFQQRADELDVIRQATAANLDQLNLPNVDPAGLGGGTGLTAANFQRNDQALSPNLQAGQAEENLQGSTQLPIMNFLQSTADLEAAGQALPSSRKATFIQELAEQLRAENPSVSIGRAQGIVVQQLRAAERLQPSANDARLDKMFEDFLKREAPPADTLAAVAAPAAQPVDPLNKVATAARLRQGQ